MKEKERIDLIRPEESFLLHREFYSPKNKVFDEIEKGPKLTYMAS